MTLRRFAFVLAATLGAANCSKTITGVFDLNGTTHTIQISGTLANTEGAATIQRVRVSLDGHEVSTVPIGQATDQVLIFGSRPGARGSHTLAIAVLEQTTSPTNYRLSGVRVSLIGVGLLGSGPTLAQTTLLDRSESLVSGGEISYQFNL